LLTEPLTQRLLSSKHLLTTKSRKVEWGDTFEQFFQINIDNISYFNPKIKIRIDNVDFDEMTDLYSFKEMTVIDAHNKEYFIELPLPLTINNNEIELERYFKEDEECYLITDKADTDIFYYTMANIELSNALMRLKDVLDKNDYLKEHNNIEVINYLMELIEESGININAVHLELIVRCLTIMDKRADWAKEEVPEYYMCKIKDSILNGKSLTKSIVFEELSKQLTTLKYGIFEKSGDSLLDNLI